MKTKDKIHRQELLMMIKKQESVNNLRFRHVNVNFGIINTRSNNLLQEIKGIILKQPLLPGECTRYLGKLTHLLRQIKVMRGIVGKKATIDVDSCLNQIREKIKIQHGEDVDLLVEQFESISEQMHKHYYQYHILSCLEKLHTKVKSTIEAITNYNNTVYQTKI